ncbi:MAG: hypothetical protein ACRDK9_03130 [Solirubrobacterales bacterium]
MSSGDSSEFPVCAVCARTILRGERVSDYLTPEGESVSVCSLCKPRAEASGWTPAALAGRIAGTPSPRRRRGINLRERIARVSEAASSRLSRGQEEPTERKPTEPPRARQRPAGESPPATHEPPSPERALRRAIEAFNRSPEARTVSGLRRSLGEPQASVRTDGSGDVRVTVAWELSWYQWAIEGAIVREVGKGKELAELARPDRDWNAEVAEDGSLLLAPQPQPERVRG